MSANLETLGIAQVDIRYVRLQSVRDGWAYIRVPVVIRGGRGGSLEITDNRPSVIKAAEKVFAISAEINAVRRRRTTGMSISNLRNDLRDTLAAFQSAFRSPAIVSVRDRVTVGGQISYQQIVLNDARDDEPNAILAVVRTRGTWHRDPYRSQFQPVFADRERRMALHPVFANSEGVTVWELGDDRVRAFRVSFPDGFVMTTYEAVTEEEPEEDEVEVPAEAVDAEAPPEEAQPTPTEPDRHNGKNGKTAIECPECGKKVRVGTKRLSEGVAICPKCKAQLEP